VTSIENHGDEQQHFVKEKINPVSPAPLTSSPGVKVPGGALDLNFPSASRSILQSVQKITSIPSGPKPHKKRRALDLQMTTEPPNVLPLSKKNLAGIILSTTMGGQSHLACTPIRNSTPKHSHTFAQRYFTGRSLPRYLPLFKTP
jgi:hypothetical protein